MFKFWTYKCLHTGNGHEDTQYTMRGNVLNTSVELQQRRETTTFLK